jgi:hypothetical protein
MASLHTVITKYPSKIEVNDFEKVERLILQALELYAKHPPNQSLSSLNEAWLRKWYVRLLTWIFF